MTSFNEMIRAIRDWSTSKFSTKTETKEVADKVDAIEEVVIKTIEGVPSEASGKSILLSDSANTQFKSMNLYGKTVQESTTGKNLLNMIAESKTYNGVTFTVNEDKSVSVSGTAIVAGSEV